MLSIYKAFGYDIDRRERGRLKKVSGHPGRVSLDLAYEKAIKLGYSRF